MVPLESIIVDGVSSLGYRYVLSPHVAHHDAKPEPWTQLLVGMLEPRVHSDA